MAAKIPECRLMEQCLLCKCALTKAPKLLTCFHSFCEECLRKKMKSLKAGETMPCPQCHMTTTIPTEGVNGLADDFLQSTKQKLAILHDGKVKFCNVCEFIGDEILAFFYCINCQYHLCERDKKSHKATPNQRDHYVISYEEMNSGKYDPEIVASTLGKCQLHSSKPLTFYCKECNTLVCHDCILATHKGHKLTSLQEVSSEYQRKVDEVLNKVCKTKEIEIETMKAVEKDIQDLNDDKDKLVNEIEKRGKYLISSINDVSQNMIQDVKVKYTTEEEKCKKAIQTLKGMGLCAENVESFIEQCLKYSSDIFVISHHKNIIRNAEVCLKNLQATPEVQLKSYAFVSHDNTLTEGTLQLLFGDIKEAYSEARTEEVSTLPQTPKPTEEEKEPKQVSPQHVSLTNGKGITLLRQIDIPGILDVTVLDSGGIIVLTSSAVCKLVKESSLEAIFSHKNEKMCNLQSYRDNIYVSVKDDTNVVLISDVDGNVKLTVNVPGQNLVGVWGTAVDPGNGTLYFGSAKGKVYKYDIPYNNGPRVFAQQLNAPSSLCCDSGGNCIISDRGRHEIMKYDSTGRMKWQYGSFGKGYGQLDTPKGVCTDDKGYIYVADYNNHRVHVLSPDGLCLHFVNCHDQKNVSSSPCGLHYRDGKLYVTSKNPDLLTEYKIG